MNESQQSVQRAIEPVKVVYQTILQNAVLRNKLAKTGLSDTQWREVERLVALGDTYAPDEYDVYNLYSYIRSMLAFARSLVTEVKPALRSELSRPRSATSTENRVALEMTVSNLDSNVRILLGRLSDLYIAARRVDEKQQGSERARRNEFRDLADAKTWEIASW